MLAEFHSSLPPQLPSSVGLGLALRELFERRIYDKYDIAIRFDADDINLQERFLF